MIYDSAKQTSESDRHVSAVETKNKQIKIDWKKRENYVEHAV